MKQFCEICDKENLVEKYICTFCNHIKYVCKICNVGISTCDCTKCCNLPIDL